MNYHGGQRVSGLTSISNRRKNKKGKQMSNEEAFANDTCKNFMNANFQHRTKTQIKP